MMLKLNFREWVALVVMCSVLARAVTLILNPSREGVCNCSPGSLGLGAVRGKYTLEIENINNPRIRSSILLALSGSNDLDHPTPAVA